MLTWLRVRNLALVEEAEVGWGEGLNVVTGETGAGKSILVGALLLLMGERADSGAVRKGADKCTVEGRFRLDDPAKADAALEEAGLPACEDGELILRRTVKAGGGGQAWINDAPATLGLMKRVAGGLVDLHGPHDQQSLFKTSAQREALDEYAGDGEELRGYEAAWAAWRAARERVEELEGEENSAEQAEWLRERVAELEEAALDEEEERSAREELQTLGHRQRILELGQQIVQSISEAEVNALAVLGPGTKAAEELGGLLEEGAGWAEEMRRLADGLAGVSMSVQRRLGDLEGEAERMEWLEQRVWTYEKMKRKYGGTVAGALAVLAESKAKLRDLEDREGRLSEAREAEAAARKRVEAAGKKLSAARKAAAAKLGPAVTRELRAIGFETGALEARVEAAEAGPKGADAVEFTFAPNQGEGARELRAIASSGEISRVMLALKVVLAGADGTDVLVFDEIDANVGGATAHAVGKKLREAARARQVIAITHLPAVAVCGETHFQVSKSLEDGRTVTRVARLEGEAREREITRMLGGEAAGGKAAGELAREWLGGMTQRAK